MIMRIKVTNGTFIIDESSYKKIQPYKWYIAKSKTASGKARIQIIAPAIFKTDPSVVQLSRLITDAKKGLVVDHINGDVLDNRLCNLRICTQRENTKNRTPRQKKKNGTSIYRGVRNVKNRWLAYITVNFNSIFLGEFASEIDAAYAYDFAARIVYGSYYSRPNFDDHRDVKVENINLLNILKE